MLMSAPREELQWDTIVAGRLFRGSIPSLRVLRWRSCRRDQRMTSAGCPVEGRKIQLHELPERARHSNHERRGTMHRPLFHNLAVGVGLSLCVATQARSGVPAPGPSASFGLFGGYATNQVANLPGNSAGSCDVSGCLFSIGQLVYRLSFNQATQSGLLCVAGDGQGAYENTAQGSGRGVLNGRVCVFVNPTAPSDQVLVVSSDELSLVGQTRQGPLGLTVLVTGASTPTPGQLCVTVIPIEPTGMITPQPLCLPPG
jgi:hypothetical protein